MHDHAWVDAAGSYPNPAKHQADNDEDRERTDEAVREPEHERRSPERDLRAEPREQFEAEAAVTELFHDRHDHRDDDQVERELAAREPSQDNGMSWSALATTLAG